MTSDDPYEILGVRRDATPDEINAAYREQARKAHPDAGGNTEKFTRIKQASLVLLSPKLRSQYDKTGKFEEVEPSNRRAKIMELIVNFFVTSIEALDDPRAPGIDQVDLVKVGKDHFNQQIVAAAEHARKLEVKIFRFEKALKRLKSKNENDIVRIMLVRHTSIIKGLVRQTKDEQELFREVLTVLEDYSFEPGQAMLTATQQQNQRYNTLFGDPYKGFFT